ncbi:hypothetical protein ACT41N_00735 [Acinetobacter baumannii]|nr:hypothetical protein [Acinetobacter baumannii]HEN9595348.1 hypothetical protein [Acinetobacter baumannii]
MFSLDPQKKKSFWTEIDFYKDHWSIIIFIPAFFGGFFQISRLYILNPSFIRFFSVQQVIPDGLFILFLMFLSMIIYFFLNPSFKVSRRMDHRLKPKDIYKNSMYKIFQVLFFILVCSYIHFSDKEFSITIIIIQFILIVVSSIYLCEIFFIIASTYIFRNLDRKHSPTNSEKAELVSKFFDSTKWYLILIFIIVPIILLLWVYFSTGILIFYNQVNKLPPTTNEVIFLKKVRDNLKIDGSLNIEYYNGSYIFIKVNNKADQYLILKGESFINLIDKDEK